MLAEIIKQSGKPRKDWAAALGISAPYLSDILNGNRLPSLALAARIERQTDGAVLAVSWVYEPAADDGQADSAVDAA